MLFGGQSKLLDFDPDLSAWNGHYIAGNVSGCFQPSSPGPSPIRYLGGGLRLLLPQQKCIFIIVRCHLVVLSSTDMSSKSSPQVPFIPESRISERLEVGEERASPPKIYSTAALLQHDSLHPSQVKESSASAISSIKPPKLVFLYLLNCIRQLSWSKTQQP